MRGRNFTLSTGLALCLTVGVLSSMRRVPASRMAFDLYPDRPECPHSYRKVAAPGDGEIVNGPVVTPPASWSGDDFATTQNIPEFNDCQRILIPPTLDWGRPATAYGPLMSVFVSDSVTTLAPSHNVIKKTEAIAAALILNYSRGFYYRPLGIVPLYNCLFLWGITGNWQAMMVPVFPSPIIPAMPSPKCQPGITDSMSAIGTPLKVIETKSTNFTRLTQYPAAARWEFDDKSQTQYIGLRCAMAWCSIGAPSRPGVPAFERAPAYVDPVLGTPAVGDSVRAIPGWYDRQRLAVPDTLGRAGRGGARGESSIGSRPSNIIGTVFPTPGLKSMDPKEIAFATFKVVAHVALERASLPTDPAAATREFAYYLKKFNYVPVAPNSVFAKMSTISLCYGLFGDCKVVDTEVLRNSCGGLAAVADGKVTPRWWARLDQPKGSTAHPIYRCVNQVDHSGAYTVELWATTRWRWIVKDETTWDYCIAGCCEVEGNK
jgi:hypothetical protein